MSYLPNQTSVSDREGLTGLPYRSSGDPRTQTVTHTDNHGVQLYFPAKYGAPSVAPLVVASGVEARLIEAEVALHAGDVAGYLARLNHLRQTAISPALPDLTDPGAELSGQAATDARLDTLFAERAAWLFATGTRQGDLRRLVRPVSQGGYGRNQAQVYPSGVYTGTGGGVYGTDVNVPIPANEQYNPLFTGCFNRGA